MKKIKGIFPKIYDFENLFCAYKAAIKCKRYRQDVMEYTDRLEDNLIILQNELIWGQYSVGRYNIFYVYEPKKRLIMSLLFKDRVAQHAIYRQVNPIFEKKFIFDSYACRVGKGTHKAIDRLQYWLKQTDRKPKKYYYLKLDVSKYFYRIDHGILKKILAKMIDDPPLLDLLAKIIDCEDTKFGLPLGADIGDVAFDRMLDDVGLPIGNLTSQMFANLYLNELDQFCKHKLRLHFYIRYMDDIIILHDDKKYLEKIKQDIAVFLGKKLNLQLNNKTCIRPTSMGIEFVGFRVWATHRKLRKKTAKKLKRRLQYMFHAYTIGEIDKDTLDRSVASYRGILKHFDSYGLRKSLMKCIKRRYAEMSQELLRTAKEILAWLAAAGIIIDLTPGIKFQPVRYIIKRIGALMNHDIKEQLDKIEKDLQQHKVESWRHEILTFANECMNRRKHTKEEFDNFFETYSDYEEYIKANKLQNGRVDMAYKYVSNVYMRRCEKNDFLVEREEGEE